jgi:ATP-binding cassette subfamily C (CFTR/MRP) protein 1
VSLYELLGPATFVGVAIMILSIPLNTLAARKLKTMNEQQMKNRDKRTALMSELLTNMKRYAVPPSSRFCPPAWGSDGVARYSIKMYAWEFAFMRKVLQVRNELELKMLRKIGVWMVCTFELALSEDALILSLSGVDHSIVVWYTLYGHSPTIKSA